MEISYGKLSEFALEYDKDSEALMEAMKNEYSSIPPAQFNELAAFVKQTFLPQLKRKWAESCRKMERFKLKNLIYG